MSEITLILSNDSGSYQALFGQFIESAVADTFADRILAQQAAAASAASQAAAAANESGSFANAQAAASQAAAAATSAANAQSSQTAASSSAISASSSQSAAASSASAAGVSATNASNSATSASTSAANAAAVLAGALTKANNLSDVANAATARSNIGAAATSGNLSQFAATSSAQLAALLSDETGTGSAVFGTGPTINQPNVVGVVNGSNAAAGSIGEYLTASASAVPMSNGVPTNVVSMPLPAGDWDVQSVIAANVTGSTNVVNIQGGATTSSATPPTAVGSRVVIPVFATGLAPTFNTPKQRFSLSVTTTIYIVVTASFTASTMTADGVVTARRIH